MINSKMGFNKWKETRYISGSYFILLNYVFNIHTIGKIGEQIYKEDRERKKEEGRRYCANNKSKCCIKCMC